MPDQDKPYVTFALFVYNQERYVREAVHSAFAQTYSPLEIIISDDCSSDVTYEIVQQLAAEYAGPHAIRLNRNATNLGLAPHINAVMAMTAGELIVVGAGDDVSMPNRVDTLVSRWCAGGREADCIYSAMLEIDTESELTGKRFEAHGPPLEKALKNSITSARSVYGAANAWTPRVWQQFGPLMAEVVNEDLAIPFRASLMGGVAHLDIPLVYYRSNQGLASDNGRAMSRVAAYNPRILRRNYVNFIQRTKDLQSVGADADWIVLVKNRRAEYLFRYALYANRRFTRRRILFFVRRCRVSWLLKETAKKLCPILIRVEMAIQRWADAARRRKAGDTKGTAAIVHEAH